MARKAITDRMDLLAREYDKTLPDNPRRQELADELSALALMLDTIEAEEP